MSDCWSNIYLDFCPTANNVAAASYCHVSRFKTCVSLSNLSGPEIHLQAVKIKTQHSHHYLNY
jgi:hypothetical protein